LAKKFKVEPKKLALDLDSEDEDDREVPLFKDGKHQRCKSSLTTHSEKRRTKFS